MPNIYVGKPVSYLKQNPGKPWKWTAARIGSIVNASTVTLVTNQGVSLNAGANVSLKTAHGQTGVFKHH
jgi:hypothetical protein